MPRTVSLGQLKADVMTQADIVGFTVRHPPTILTRPINQSHNRFREQVCAEGGTVGLEVMYGTLVAGNATGMAFGILTLAVPTGLVRPHSIYVVRNNDARELTRRPFRDFGGDTGTLGWPREYAHYKRDRLALKPGPDSAYTYALWYLPTVQDLVDDGDTIEVGESMDEAIVWDAIVKVIQRDKYPEAYRMALEYRNDVWNNAVSMATRVSEQGGAVIGRDTFGKGLYRVIDELPPP